jgi:uncharacterized membrane protein YuzA (DUF378 family)
MASQPSAGARVAAIVLAVLSGLIWIAIVPSLTGLGGSDPAGNAMAQGFTALALILLWGLLSILALIAAIAGAMPAWARAALIVVPASGLAAVAALDLLGRPGSPPGHWPILIPALVPPLAIYFCLFAMVRPLGSGVAAALLGTILLVSAAVVPVQKIRSAQLAQERQASADLRAALARVGADAPLWELTPFLEARDQTIVSDALARIPSLPQRQRDAETMLARGDFPLGYLSRFNLDPTATLCENARAQLAARAAKLMPRSPGTQPYAVVAQDIEDAVAAMSWLVGYGCACDAEALAWEATANAYVGSSYDVVRLRELRQPKELGRRLREDPDKFSQLGPQSHLKAWLKFSDDEKLRRQVIAGVRTLDHRGADAIEILTDKYQQSGRFRLLRILPAIDLEPSVALCAAAAREVGGEIRAVYRPAPQDPSRRYSELIDRLGVGEPLNVLVWLGEHGCDVRDELREAVAAVRAYQESADRAAMLGTLARLQGR